MSSLWAFPGQGAQQVGMLHSLPNAMVVAECVAEASAALGEDVLNLDSAEALASTRAVQLCLLISGVACARLLLEDGPAPAYVAGLSIGAYGAAVVAGALAFADAVRLVALRGELMQRAFPNGYGMTAISGVSLAQLEQLITASHTAESPVYLANINSDAQQVIAGSDAGMRTVADSARSLGAGLAQRLAVSVPSHCPLLAEPAGQLAEAFAEIEIRRPVLRYLSSSSARPIHEPERLRDDLSFNMCRVVNWHDTLCTAQERGVHLHLELPPGTVLSGFARRVFSPGNAVAFQGTRLDTVGALLRREDAENR